MVETKLAQVRRRNSLLRFNIAIIKVLEWSHPLNLGPIYLLNWLVSPVKHANDVALILTSFSLTVICSGSLLVGIILSWDIIIARILLQILHWLILFVFNFFEGSCSIQQILAVILVNYVTDILILTMLIHYLNIDYKF